ncbi:MAG TPA: GNAT family N-acetyltransferase [Thermoanaerobaculia bacterium]|nr:GNAT family N-acetyltransferase [Thermoanaerobaculia bacterium]
MTDDRVPNEPGRPRVDFYPSTYGRFDTPLYREIRAEAFGEDLGANSWLTPRELAEIAGLVGLGASSRLLDVGCGPGGPAIRLARTSGCLVTGIDRDEHGIARARACAASEGLEGRARFEIVDAGGALPFEPQSFDAVVCIDAVNHFPDRAAVFGQWRRVLRPGGRLLFTDPIVVSRAVSADELFQRAAIGFYLYLPPGENERLLAEAGLNLLRREDRTESVETIARRRREARGRRAEELRSVEGAETFEGQQRFLEACETLARRRQLSRVLFLAERTEENRKPAPGEVPVRLLASDEEVRECARMMADSEPWITLRRGYADSLAYLRDASRERFVAIEDGRVAGFLILNMTGALVGYIQTVCVAPQARGRGVGSALIRFAEERVFRESPNIFLCVSDFNPRARRLYERLGYRAIGELSDYVVAGHAEILMRKSIGPRTGFPAGQGGTQ